MNEFPPERGNKKRFFFSIKQKFFQVKVGERDAAFSTLLIRDDLFLELIFYRDRIEGTGSVAKLIHPQSRKKEEVEKKNEREVVRKERGEKLRATEKEGE